MFWFVTAIVAFSLSAIYADLGAWGTTGIGTNRLRMIRRSSRGLFAWAAICAAHYAAS